MQARKPIILKEVMVQEHKIHLERGKYGRQDLHSKEEFITIKVNQCHKNKIMSTMRRVVDGFTREAN